MNELNNTSHIKNLMKHYNNKKFDKAEELALDLTVKFSDNPLPWKVLGAIFSQTGRKFKAIEANKKALQLAPKDHQTYNNLGITLQELNRFSEAEESFRKSILFKDDFFEAHNNLGVTLKELGRFDEAIASFRRSILFNNEFPGSHNNLGNMLKKLGKFDEAEESFRKSIALNSNNADAHNNLGNLLKDKGNLLEAINCFKNAINIKPDFTEAWNNIFFPLQAIKTQTSSIEKYISSLIERAANKHANIYKSILIYRLNDGSSSIDNYLDETINILSTADNISIKNPQNPSGKLISDLAVPKKISALIHFGRSGTGLLHSLVDGHSQVSTLPSIYLSEFFDHLTWNKLLANGWNKMAKNFTKIYAVLFDASSSIEIATKGMAYINNVGQKEGMTNVGTQKNEVVSVDKEIFIKELNNLIDCYDSIDQIVFFRLVHLAYEKALNNSNKKKQIFYHIHNPDKYAQLNFLRLAPNASWLMMVREPIQSCESWINKDFNNNKYKNIVSKIFQMLFDIDQPMFKKKNSIGIKLEDLKMYPKRTISSLCDWLGINEEESLYQMTVQGKKWWGDPTSRDYKSDGMHPFGKKSINRRLGIVFSNNDQFILRTLFYPFSLRFGYTKENLDKFKSDLLVIKPLMNKMFDFEKKIAQNMKINSEDFMKSGSYLLLRSGMFDRWNTLTKFYTYPNMLKPLKIK